MKGKHKGHKHRKGGGRAHEVVSGNPDVLREAEEKKHGGKVGKHVGHVHGKSAHHRMDRPGRKRGGRVGADKAPLSSAHKTASPAAEEAGGRPD